MITTTMSALRQVLVSGRFSLGHWHDVIRLTLWLAILAAEGANMSGEAMGQEGPAGLSWESAAEAMPKDAPEDSVMASPSDCAEAAGWALAAFGDDKASARATTNLDLLFAGVQIPFSFRYDARPSSELLKTWDRKAEARDLGDRAEQTVRWTDAKTGLVVTAVVTGYKRYAAVEWLLFFENRGVRSGTMMIGG